jgi:glycosyltransferase involved in cell wall biosynthesis
MKVSAVILTYNEEVRIKDCLASATWCDEVIVVDGYSTDNTVEIARQFTDKVFLSDRLGPTKPGGFADQRNYGLEQSTCDWVFYLDADEHFTPELATEVRKRLQDGIPADITIFRVRRREHYFGVYTPYTHGEAWQTRMLRRGAARWDTRLVHEGLITEGKTESLNGYLLHFSKDSISDYLATQNRYTSLEAEQAVADGAPMPKSPLRGIIHTFLNLYVYKGSYREGAFGLIMSLFFAQYYFLCWAKRWELEMKAGRIKPDQPRLRGLERLAAFLSFIWQKKSPPRP